MVTLVQVLKSIKKGGIPKYTPAGFLKRGYPKSFSGGTQNFGGVPKITPGEPKITLGGASQKWRGSQKGVPNLRGYSGAGFWKRGDPKFGIPSIWVPLYFGSPSHIWVPLKFGIPSILGPLKFGIPSIWDPSIFGIPYLRRRRKNLAIKLVESFCILSSNHTAILRCRRKF